MKKIDILDERGDYLKEILEKPPNRIISWGNTLVFGFIVIVLLLSWLVRYPDIIQSEVTITTENPPVYLSSKVEGKIDVILKNNKESARKGDWLAVIGSNANLKHVEILDSILQKIKLLNYNTEDIYKMEFPILNVGEMQSNYNNLVKSVIKSRYYKEDGNYEIQSDLNKLRVQQYGHLINVAIKEKEIAAQELNVAKMDLDRYGELLKKGVIAQKEYETVELRYLQAVRNLETNEAQITRIKSQRLTLLSEGEDMQQTEEETYLDAELDILEAAKLTELSFLEWEKKHVLVSTVSGQVNYLDFFSDNRYVALGQQLISVIPQYENNDYFGTLRMPVLNSGKVKKGQSVNIKLHGFPHEEYGMILGEIDNISEVPNEDFYLVRVNLSNGLKTTYDKELTFRQNINGSAEIITEDLRLIERFIYTLTKSFR